MAHIIVDGYNFIRRVPRFLEAEGRSLEEGRYELLLALEEYAAGHGYRVTVVFDGGSRPAHMGPELPRREKFAGIDIIFSDMGRSADSEIMELIAKLREQRARGEGWPEGGEIVVSDDLEIRDHALELGAFTKSTEDLIDAMEGKMRLSV